MFCLVVKSFYSVINTLLSPNKIRFTDLPEKLAEKAIRLTAKALVGKKVDKEIATEIHK